MKIQITKDGAQTTIDVSSEEVNHLISGFLNLKSSAAAEPEPKENVVRFTSAEGCSWGEFKNICALREAHCHFKPGMIFRTMWNDTLAEFVVVKVKEDRLLIQATHALVDMTFDASENEKSADGAELPNRYRKYGYNSWKESAIRQYLNSSAGEGEWWKAQNPWDAPPDELKEKPGFAAGFADDIQFLHCVIPSKVITAQNGVDGKNVDITNDMFFLPSVTELFGRSNNGHMEGERFDIDLAKVRQDEYWWLRSPHVGNANYVYNVSATGTLTHNSANFGSGCAPACWIG